MSQIQIQLQPSCLFNVPLQTYDKDFTFVINGEEFHTSRLVSDLLSPMISKLHLNDPTTDRIIINTQRRGDFSRILQLTNFSTETISEDEFPFFSEIIEKLDIKKIDLNVHEPEINGHNVFQLITKHEKFQEEITIEIEYISSHFYELFESDENIEELSKLSIDTVYQILNSSTLQLKDEDQIVKIINKLYQRSNFYSILYETVKFENVTVKVIEDFIEIFDINDMTNEIWRQISIRLQKELKKEEEEPKMRYKTQNINKKTFSFSNDNKMEGIINFLNQESNNKIEEKINFSSSGLYYGINENYYPKVVALHNDCNKYFMSSNIQNSWICLDFKEKRVIPTCYTIKNAINNFNYMKSWTFEGSNDNTNWTILDEQKDCQYLRGLGCFHTFKINNQISTKFKYIRIHHNGPNWYNQNILIIESLEIYGTLI